MSLFATPPVDTNPHIIMSSQGDSLPSQVRSTELSYDLITRLGHMLTQEELQTFVPIVQEENVFMVNKTYENLYLKINRITELPELFSVKGYTFIQNPSFPVELGDQLMVSSEEKELFSDGTYRVHVILTSLHTGRSQSFTSLTIDEKGSSTILKAVEKERYIGTSKDHYLCHGYDSDTGYCSQPEYYPILRITSDVTLQDGSNYELVYIFDKYGTSNNDLIALSENFYIDVEDSIQFRNKFTCTFDKKLARRYQYGNVSLSGKKPEGIIIAYGFNRSLQDYNKSSVYSINKSNDDYHINIKNFGMHANSHYVQFRLFYENGKEIESRKTYKDTPMRMLGYFTRKYRETVTGYRHQGIWRAFLLLDDSGNLYYATSIATPE